LKILKKRRKAQQLVEFAIMLPSLMILLLIILEFGYAVYVRGILADATRVSLIKVNQLYNTAGNDEEKLDQIKAQIRQYIDDYLYKNNIPYSGSVTVNIADVSGTNISVVTVKYIYYPSFILPDILGGSLIPKKIGIFSSQVVNTALIKANSYNSYLETNQLSSVTSSTSIVNDPITEFIPPN
jgi:Flp pilus assembly protein TadG